MLRWRIERDYQELKDELGLDHFEGRGWRGFHHPASLCIAAYAFLAAERLAHFPPEPLAFLPAPRLPKRFLPRGAPRASGAARAGLHRHAVPPPHGGAGPWLTVPRMWSYVVI